MRNLLLIVATLLLLSACAPALKGGHIGNLDGAISVYHDDDRGVTCWAITGTGNAALVCMYDKDKEVRGGPDSPAKK